MALGELKPISIRQAHLVPVLLDTGGRSLALQVLFMDSINLWIMKSYDTFQLMINRA